MTWRATKKYRARAIQAKKAKLPDAICIELVLLGANVNATADDGLTALMIAATAGKASAVQLLIDAKADVNAWFGDGETILATARRRKHEDVVQMLVGAGATD